MTSRARCAGTMGLRALCVLSVSIAAVSTATAGTIRHDRPDAAYLAVAQQPQFASVTYMVIDQAYACTATLIAPQWMLTAAHCVTGSSKNQFDFYFSNDLMAGGTLVKGSEKFVHPGWNGQLFNGFDIALVKLDQPVDFVTPTGLFRDADDIGRMGTNVGFGLTGDGLVGITGVDGKKRGGHNMLDMHGGDAGISPSLMLLDFDSPLDPRQSSMGDDAPLDLEYFPVFGDSGSSLFIERDGEWLAAGVLSFIGSFVGNPVGKYGELAGATRVNQVLDWIDSIIPEPHSGIALTTLLLLAARGRRRC